MRNGIPISKTATRIFLYNVTLTKKSLLTLQTLFFGQESPSKSNWSISYNFVDSLVRKLSFRALWRISQEAANPRRTSTLMYVLHRGFCWSIVLPSAVILGAVMESRETVSGKMGSVG
eukprot:GHVP01069369.1.p1 GENE.GHVP01069369.1~~GHVP01069369.1.p1  ORF type:complete len:118 (+),score=10.03 GHVP01069369.1:659-1012(+)